MSMDTPKGKGQHDDACPGKLLAPGGQSYRTTKGGSDAGRSNRAQQNTAEKLATRPGQRIVLQLLICAGGYSGCGKFEPPTQ